MYYNFNMLADRRLNSNILVPGYFVFLNRNADGSFSLLL